MIFRKLFLLLGCCFFILLSFSKAQNSWKPDFNPTKSTENFNKSAAIFFNENILVNVYSSKPGCFMGTSLDGYVTVYKLAEKRNGAANTDKIPFQIAIYNKEKKTMRMFSSRVYEYIKWQEIVQELLEDESVYIMLTDKQYTLEYHEIKIMKNDGC